MKILLAVPGHLRTVPMGRYSFDALRALGHEVVMFDYHGGLLDRIDDRWRGLIRRLRRGNAAEEKRSVNLHLRRVIDEWRPSVFIAIFGIDVSIETLEYLRARHVASACWWINDPFQFQRSLRKARYYDVLCSNSAGSVEDYRSAGVSQAYFLPTACDPAVHQASRARPEYACDVCFAGDWSPLREQVMESLANEFDVRVFGPWGKKLAPGSRLRARLSDGFFAPDDMAAIFSSAKVVLNIHTWYGRFDHGVNPRLFEAAGCGAFQLVDWKREIPELFDCLTEVRCYRDIGELAPLLREVLADATARKAAAAAAQRRAYSEHSYVHRMRRLLEIVTSGRHPGADFPAR